MTSKPGAKGAGRPARDGRPTKDVVRGPICGVPRSEGVASYPRWAHSTGGSSTPGLGRSEAEVTACLRQGCAIAGLSRHDPDGSPSGHTLGRVRSPAPRFPQLRADAVTLAGTAPRWKSPVSRSGPVDEVPAHVGQGPAPGLPPCTVMAVVRRARLVRWVRRFVRRRRSWGV